MSKSIVRPASTFICASCRAKSSPAQWRRLLSPSTTSRALSTTPQLARDAIASMFRNPRTRSAAAPPASTRSQLNIDNLLEGITDGDYDGDAARYAYERAPQPHRLHVYATKHNTHITFTRPAPPPAKFDMADAYKPPAPNEPVLTYAAGNIGFKKAGRGSYDAAYQLASFVFKQIQERGLLIKDARDPAKEVKEVEVVLRGFGAGREAVTKALMGQEGRMLRPRVTAVTDATKLKFGGSRSPNPRRLG